MNETDVRIAVLMIITVLLSVINAFLTPLYDFRYIVAASMLIALFSTLYFSSENRKILFEISILGLIAGFIELLADYFLVVNAGLTYNSFEFFILESPLYIPFAWSLIIIQLGYVGFRLYQSIGKAESVLLTGLLGSFYVGFAEILAHSGNLWSYSSAPFSYVYHSPFYILLGEGLMFSLLVLVIKEKYIFNLNRIPVNTLVLESSMNRGLFKGTLFGVIIFLSYISSYYLMQIIGLVI